MMQENDDYDLMTEELWQLSELHRRGSLSTEEFEIAKIHLLGGFNPWHPFVSGLIIGGSAVAFVMYAMWPSSLREELESDSVSVVEPAVEKPIITVDATDPNEGVTPQIPLRALSTYDLNGYHFHQVPSGEFKVEDNRIHVRGFFIGKTEVTHDFYNSVITTEDPGNQFPVTNISWYDAADFANRLSVKSGLSPCYKFTDSLVLWPIDCTGYRLPTEIEWSYAAQAGESGRFSGGAEASLLAWYKGNSEKRTHAVAQLGMNSLGLYDMSGNVAEWVWDWHTDDWTNEPIGQVSGPLSGEERVVRGGHFESRMKNVSLTSRAAINPEEERPTVGFRLVRTVTPSE